MATTSPPVRYAVVGMGHIAQVAVLPAFEHAENSVLTALVSGDPEKRDALAKRYRVDHVCSYEELDDLLGSGVVDAVYLAVPNDRHREMTVRAARHGVHVLCEKPMAMTESECEEMIRACDEGDVRLMIAYRLHFEEANMRAVETVRRGAIGAPRLFASTFSMLVKEKDVRTDPVRGGGPLYDIGIYCINAARYLFRDEPIRVVASAVQGPEARFQQVEEALAVALHFPGGRMANLTVGFGTASADDYRILGSEGDLHMEPAYGYAEELGYTITVGGKSERHDFEKRDQFGPELVYFSDCVLEGRRPEPDGYEGLADIRIIEAVRKSAREGQPVDLEPVPQHARPGLDQEMKKPPVEPPTEIRSSGPRAG